MKIKFVKILKMWIISQINFRFTVLGVDNVFQGVYYDLGEEIREKEVIGKWILF